MPDISDLMIHSLTHQRKERTSNGKGGFTEEYVTIETVDGRVNPASTRDFLVAQQKQAQVKWVIYLAPDSDVQINDKYIYGHRHLIVTVEDVGTPSIPIYQKVFTIETQKAG